MNSKSLLAVSAALIIGVGGGYALREPVAVQRPLSVAAEASGASSPIDEATLLRFAAALEALERRLGQPRAAVERSTPREADVRTPLGAAPLGNTSEIVDVLRSIDARLARLNAKGGFDSQSLTTGRPSAERSAWEELAARKDPIQHAELERFFREHLDKEDWGITPELYFVEPWDVIRQFGWPSELDRGSIDSETWSLTYNGLSISSSQEEQPITTMYFHFYHGQLNDLDYDVE